MGKTYQNLATQTYFFVSLDLLQFVDNKKNVTYAYLATKYEGGQSHPVSPDLIILDYRPVISS